MKISWILLLIVMLSFTIKTQENEDSNNSSFDESIQTATDSIQPASITQNEYYEQRERSVNYGNHDEQTPKAPTEINDVNQNEADDSQLPPYLAKIKDEKQTYNHFEPEYPNNNPNQIEDETPKSYSIGGDHANRDQSTKNNGYNDDNSNQRDYTHNQNQNGYYDSDERSSLNYGDSQNYSDNDQNGNNFYPESTRHDSEDSNYQDDPHRYNLKEGDGVEQNQSLSASSPLLEDAKVSQLGPNNEMPKPVGFVAEMETVSLIFKYEKVIATFKEFISNGAENLEANYGVPFPLNYIIMVWGTVVSIYVSNKVREYMCRQKKEKPHVFNTVDHIDMRKIMKMLEDIQSKSNSRDSPAEASNSKPNMELQNIEQQKEIAFLRDQISELREEIKEMREQESKSFKMIESIATSQNDLETNVYKSLIKIYNKIERVSKNSSSAKERDASPISFRYKTDPI